MIIRVSDIPEEGLHVPIRDDRQELEYGGIKFRLAKPFSGFMNIKKASGRRVIIEGSVGVTLILTCSRCLEEFEFDIAESFRDEFFPIETLNYTEKELSKKDLDTLFYVRDEIDLSLVYLEKAYLSIPMKPLCRAECKGICPICGKNLNEGSCSCVTKRVDPRWAALLEIKEKLIKR